MSKLCGCTFTLSLLCPAVSFFSVLHRCMSLFYLQHQSLSIFLQVKPAHCWNEFVSQHPLVCGRYLASLSLTNHDLSSSNLSFKAQVKKVCKKGNSIFYISGSFHIRCENGSKDVNNHKTHCFTTWSLAGNAVRKAVQSFCKHTKNPFIITQYQKIEHAETGKLD